MGYTEEVPPIKSKCPKCHGGRIYRSGNYKHYSHCSWCRGWGSKPKLRVHFTSTGAISYESVDARPVPPGLCVYQPLPKPTNPSP